jgi:hypothetical protein
LNAGADPTGALRLQLAKRLQSERDMTPEAADWTVDSWASALGVDLGGPAGGFPGEPTRTVPTHPEDDLPPPPPRRGLWIALAALAGLAVAAVLFVVLNPFGRTGETGSATATATASATLAPTAEPTDTPDPSTPTPTPSPTPTPNPEDRLLARINTAIRDSCTTADWESVGDPIAQVNCDTVGMDNIAYLLFGSTDEMKDEYQRWVFADEDEGDCPGGNVPAEHGWSLVGYKNRELGRYSCWRDDDGTAWMFWTTNYADILAFGYRDDGEFDELWNGWARHVVRPLRGSGS